MSEENRSPQSGVTDDAGPEAVQLDALDPEDIAVIGGAAAQFLEIVTAYESTDPAAVR
jgi:hypothetical protein